MTGVAQEADKICHTPDISGETSGLWQGKGHFDRYVVTIPKNQTNRRDYDIDILVT